MKKQYDDFTKMNVTDMSKTMSDMTYSYINPDTKQPTVVPPNHYKGILNKIKEQYIDEVTRVQFLNIMFNQLKMLKEEDSKYFQQALICLELKIKPTELNIPERIALLETQQWLDERNNIEKTNFRLIDPYIIDYFDSIKNNKDLHRDIMGMSSDSQDQVEINIEDDNEIEMD